MSNNYNHYNSPHSQHEQRIRIAAQQFNSALTSYLQIVRGNNAIIQEMYNGILERNTRIENAVLSILQQQMNFTISDINRNRESENSIHGGQGSPIESIESANENYSSDQRSQQPSQQHAQQRAQPHNQQRTQQHANHHNRRIDNNLHARIIQNMRLQNPSNTHSDYQRRNTARYHQNNITPNLPHRVHMPNQHNRDLNDQLYEEIYNMTNELNQQLQRESIDRTSASTESLEPSESSESSESTSANPNEPPPPSPAQQPHQQPHQQYRQRFQSQHPSQRYNFYTQFPFSEATNNVSDALNHVDNMINNTFLDLLEPVVIRPSEQQISNATRITRFNDMIRPVNTVCPITLLEFQDSDEVMMILHCGHVFMPNELNNWFQCNVRCPMCRYDIRNYTRGLYGAHNNSTNVHSTLSNSEIIQSNGENNAAREIRENTPSSMIETARDSDDEPEGEVEDNEETNGSGNETDIHETVGNTEDDTETDVNITNEILDDDSFYNNSLLNNISLTHELYNDLYHSDRNSLVFDETEIDDQDDHNITE